MTSMPIPIALPLISQEQFSELVGLSQDVVRGWINKGLIPTVMPIAIAIPLISQEQFSDLVGVSQDVVRGWIDKGLIPTIKIGRRRLINVAKLTQEIMELEY